MEIHVNRFFSEPKGWDTARTFIIGTAAFFALHLYFELVYGTGSYDIVILGASSGTAAIAELLPKNQRKLAVGLQVIAIAMPAVMFLNSLWTLLS
ncbi:hypothetical protein C456_03141 [Haloferax volcanii DSM 14919]|uniref:Uncharacterized protein n=1 Tax=Haloferax lucentense (strain DSM 14919 / JCM 9276 / NCIMB 13854 / Aa 2.2) TaxID=1230452 RepID=M0GWM8_HALL2|nr:hypothetical protein C456_03141 [Haloferax lucentense DSM 14919]RDZ29890.1 hypothetical protein DEQ67_17975 [Haloferax sp. Atlit-48N]